MCVCMYVCIYIKFVCMYVCVYILSLYLRFNKVFHAKLNLNTMCCYAKSSRQWRCHAQIYDDVSACMYVCMYVCMYSLRDS